MMQVKWPIWLEAWMDGRHDVYMMCMMLNCIVIVVEWDGWTDWI